jgi:dihydroneopterin triphosphate diphosphatase
MELYKQPISVLVVIYTRQGKVLLLERADKKEAWQSVTGSVEKDEALFETAAREVLEETGIVASEHFLSDQQQQNYYEIYTHWRHRYAPSVTHNTEHVFSLLLDETIAIHLSPQEHVRYEWLAWQLAAQKVFSPSNREAILQIATQLK